MKINHARYINLFTTKFFVMKKILTLILLMVCLNGFSQDIIIKNDKTELKVKVMEILPEMVKFKYAERLEGPLYSIYKREIFMIIYADGRRESFSAMPVNKLNGVSESPDFNENADPAEATNSEEGEKSLYSLARLATIETFDLLDVEYDVRYKLGKSINFSIGMEVNATYNFSSETTGYYVYATAAYRVWLSSKNNIH